MFLAIKAHLYLLRFSSIDLRLSRSVGTSNTASLIFFSKTCLSVSLVVFSKITLHFQSLSHQDPGTSATVSAMATKFDVTCPNYLSSQLPTLNPQTLSIIYRPPPIISRPPPYMFTPRTSLTNASGHNPDPSNPIQTKDQEDMLWYFEREGYLGLALTIWGKAKRLAEQGTAMSLWRHLVADYNERRYHLYYLLLSLPPKVIASLIKNTLTRDIHVDSQIRRFAQDHLTPSSYPGVYMNVPARGSMNVTNFAYSAIAVDAGKWLSGHEVDSLLQHIKLYLSKGTKADDFARNLDSQLSSNQAHIATLIHTLDLRRYAKKDSEKEHLNAWGEAIRRLYWKRLSATKSFDCFLRCPSEVGWSINQETRLGQHIKNVHTTPIFGFFHAWSLLTGKFPLTRQYSLFRIWAKELDLARVAEIGGTLLLSSMDEDGGLNCAAPGNISWGSKSPSYTAKIWKVSKEAMFVLRPHVSAAIENDIALMKRQHNASQRAHDIIKMEQENKDREEQLGKVTLKVQGLDVEREQLRRKCVAADATYLEQLDRELPTPHPIITPFRSTVIGCIRQLGSIRNGLDKAHDDLVYKRSTNNPGILSADAALSYRATVLRVEERQAKAIRMWNRHEEGSEEKCREEFEEGSRRLEDFMARFELYGTALGPAAKREQ